MYEEVKIHSKVVTQSILFNDYSLFFELLLLWTCCDFHNQIKWNLTQKPIITLRVNFINLLQISHNNILTPEVSKINISNFVFFKYMYLLKNLLFANLLIIKITIKDLSYFKDNYLYIYFLISRLNSIPSCFRFYKP